MPKKRASFFAHDYPRNMLVCCVLKLCAMQPYLNSSLEAIPKWQFVRKVLIRPLSES